MSEVRCPCGAWVWEPPGAEVPGWSTAGGPTRRRRAYCLGCRSELGERDGAPVVEPMVPRAALEWLARKAECHTGECPFSLESYDGNPDAECAVVARGEECRDTDEWWRCWYEAALAAAEEATP